MLLTSGVYIVFFLSLISGFVTHFWFSMPKGIFVVRIIYL